MNLTRAYGDTVDRNNETLCVRIHRFHDRLSDRSYVREAHKPLKNQLTRIELFLRARSVEMN